MVVRMAGIAVVALEVACWPGPRLPPLLTGSVAVTLGLAYLGFKARALHLRRGH